MNHKSNIKNFDFTNWSSVEEIMEMAKHTSLSLEEKHILGAIKLAYYGNEAGRNKITQYAMKTTMIMVIIVTIVFISLVSFNKNTAITKSVNAATISATLKQNVDAVVESTRSAIFR